MGKARFGPDVLDGNPGHPEAGLGAPDARSAASSSMARPATTGADTILAEHVAGQVAERLDHVYVAPALCYGYTPYTDFPGTVSLRLETLEAMVRDVVFGYFKHGFRRCIVVNNHGPNEAAIEPVARDILRQYGVSLAILYPWKLAITWAKENFVEMSGEIGHGGEPTISVMMALAPGSSTRASFPITATCGARVTSTSPPTAPPVSRARKSGFQRPEDDPPQRGQRKLDVSHRGARRHRAGLRRRVRHPLRQELRRPRSGLTASSA